MVADAGIWAWWWGRRALWAATCGLARAARFFGDLPRRREFERGERAAILTYHRIVPDELAEPLDRIGLGLSTRRSDFARQVSMLARETSLLPLREVTERLAAGKTLPRRPVALTFDDGYREVLTEAAPVLDRHGLTATVFVTTGFLSGETHPWWDEARSHVARRFEARTLRAFRDAALARGGRVEPSLPLRRGTAFLDEEDLVRLVRRGWSVGGHTRTHLPLSSMGGGRLQEEVRGGLDLLRGLAPDGWIPFAYPFGAWDAEARREVREAGFSCAVTIEGDLAAFSDDPWSLPRVLVRGGMPLHRFRAEVTGALRDLLGPVGERR